MVRIVAVCGGMGKGGDEGKSEKCKGKNEEAEKGGLGRFGQVRGIVKGSYGL
jgi:hypothetical protein